MLDMDRRERGLSNGIKIVNIERFDNLQSMWYRCCKDEHAVYDSERDDAGDGGRAGETFMF
jgi:hypothetical protein